MSAEKGFVYCLVNASIPGLVKVGATTKDPITRAKELSASTSAPLPFVLAYHRAVRFPFAVEAEIHRLLDNCRTNDSREFFSIELYKVIELLERYEEDVSPLRGEIDTPYAEVFWSFDDDGSARELTDTERAAIRALEDQLAEDSCIRPYA